MLVLRPLQFLAQALTEGTHPRQLALGAALGLVVGLVPKGNLLALTLMTIMMATRVNLAVGFATAFVASWCGLLLDPLFHNLGHWLLTQDVLRGFWTSLYNAPVVPWTHFNHTVVLGSFTIGCLMILPTVRITEPLFARFAPPITARLKQLRVVRFLWGLEVGTKLSSIAS